MKAEWKPEWATTGRTPAFVGDNGPSQVVFGGNKYLWGNVSAIDVLQLAKNEGSTYDQDVHLLFAGKGNFTVSNLVLETSDPFITLSSIRRLAKRGQDSCVHPGDFPKVYLDCLER